MLDREHVVVTRHSEGANDVSPHQLIVSITHRAERPSPVGQVGVRFGVQDAIDRNIVRVQCRVLGMDMMDGSGEGPDGGDGVDSLPEEMTRIVIGPDYRPDRIAEAQERWGCRRRSRGISKASLTP